MSKPYLPPRQPDDDDLLWEQEVMDMSDAELDAESERLNRGLERAAEAFARLPRIRQYRFSRRFILTNIMENRRRLRTPSLCTIPVVVDMWRRGVRRGQNRLLMWRHFLKTGIWPGRA